MNLLLALESFRRHMDNGRWLFQRGMEENGYISAGAGMPKPGTDSVNVPELVSSFRPKIVVFWPRYEWDHREWGGTEVRPEHGYKHWECLFDRPDILRVAVLHDAGSARPEQKKWLEELKPHVYLVWYHPDSVAPLCPYVPKDKMLRTYHILDSDALPPIKDRSGQCVLSGAHSPDVYPLRTRLLRSGSIIRLGHPGYSQSGSTSNAFVAELAKYRVAVCTASSYKFALRKIFEATAAGCRVITDLPEYDVLPGINDNLVRISPDANVTEVESIVRREADNWSLDTQREYAENARRRYHWRLESGRIATALAYRSSQNV